MIICLCEGSGMVLKEKIVVLRDAFSGAQSVKALHWAAFCQFHTSYTSSFCFLLLNSASMIVFQAKNKLDRNQIRSSICLKQLKLQPFSWPFLGFLHVQDLLRAQSQSRNLSLKRCQQRKYHNNLFQEPFGVLSTPPLDICGGVPC